MSSRYADCLIASKDIHLALNKARVSSSVFIHTTADIIGESYNETLFLALVSSNSPKHKTINLTERFERALAVQLSENYDGIAIEIAAKKFFSSKPSKKIMIVLSDGLPSADNYGGKTGVNHTKQSIKKLRSSGVSVICLSLVKGVVSSNNEIYGKKNNIDCSTNFLGNMRQVVKTIISKN